MNRFFTGCALTAASFAWISAGAAFGQTGSIRGTVVDEAGQPVQNAVIQIVRQDIRGTYQTKTNGKGEYFHAGLPSGRTTRYSVTLEIAGRQRDTVENISVPLGDAVPVNFDLALLRKQQEANAAGALTEDQTRGMTEEQKRQVEEAMKERAAQLAKNRALSDAFNLGMEAMKAQQFQTAVEAFAKAAEIDPAQHAVWGQLAEAKAALAQQKPGPEQEALLTGSIEAFQKAIDLKPEDAAYRNNFALALVRAKRVSDAQAELEKAAQLDGVNAGKYYYNLGAVLMNAGQLDAAGDAFMKAISSTPNYAPAWFQYGLYLLGKASLAPDGTIQSADGTKNAFDTYLKLDPGGANAEQARLILASLGQTVATSYTNPDAPRRSRK